MERRFTYKGQVKLTNRAANADGTAGGKLITGIAAVFYDGTPDTEYVLWDWGNQRCIERILPGAYDKVLSRPDDVRCLFNHCPSNILGRTKSGTLRLSVDKEGLKYECDAADTTISRDTQAHLERGDVDGSSFAFSTDEERWTETKQEDGSLLIVRELISVTAYDVGPVTYPAYESTTAGVTDGGVSDAVDVEEPAEEASRQIGRGQLALRSMGDLGESRRALAEHRKKKAPENDMTDRQRRERLRRATAMSMVAGADL